MFFPRAAEVGAPLPAAACPFSSAAPAISPADGRRPRESGAYSRAACAARSTAENFRAVSTGAAAPNTELFPPALGDGAPISLFRVRGFRFSLGRSAVLPGDGDSGMSYCRWLNALFGPCPRLGVVGDS